MPKVERLPSGSYRIRYTDPWGRRASITAPTAADARARHNRAIGDMARGDYVDPARSRTTLGEWADHWLDTAPIGPGTRLMYTQALAHITPELGRLPLGRLGPGDIERYLTDKQAALAPSTVHRHYRTLNRLLGIAARRRMITRNPCDEVAPPKVPRAERTVLTVDQVDQLADALTRPKGKLKRGQPLDSRYRALVYVAAYGGLRWSEIVGLRRARIDGPRVAVVEQLVRRPGGEWERCETKTGRARTVTLPAFAADELAAHLDTYAQPGDDGLVFPTRNGRPIPAAAWHTTFRRALDRAKLPTIRTHDLRHTSVSLALHAGGRLEIVQGRHGHSSIKVTSDTYGHRYAGADEQVAQALDDLRAKAMRARIRAV